MVPGGRRRGPSPRSEIVGTVPDVECDLGAVVGEAGIHAPDQIPFYYVSGSRRLSYDAFPIHERIPPHPHRDGEGVRSKVPGGVIRNGYVVVASIKADPAARFSRCPARSVGERPRSPVARSVSGRTPAPLLEVPPTDQGRVPVIDGVEPYVRTQFEKSGCIASILAHLVRGTGHFVFIRLHAPVHLVRPSRHIGIVEAGGGGVRGVGGQGTQGGIGGYLGQVDGYPARAVRLPEIRLRDAAVLVAHRQGREPQVRAGCGGVRQGYVDRACRPERTPHHVHLIEGQGLVQGV